MTVTKTASTLAALAACFLLFAPSADAGSIAGTIKYEGAIPKLRPVAMTADPSCHAKHDGPVANEMLVIGEGNVLANIMVHISNPPAGDHAAPSTSAVLDQNGCKYVPHVLAVMAGQEVKILNSDGIMHNVHALPKVNKEFNMAMPGTRTEAIETFSKAEDVFTIKCDVHPWMKSYMGVYSHPFFAVTGADGSFTIDGLPDGTYELVAWHEKMGTQTATVTVSGASTQDFTFAPPKR